MYSDVARTLKPWIAGRGAAVHGAAANAAIEFLLKNPYEDGSWFVQTRPFPVQPQIESGYPFGHNQWI